MNRRNFIKLIAASVMAPYLPDIAVPENAISTFDCVWTAQKFFDYALENMRFADFIGKGNDSLIRIV